MRQPCTGGVTKAEEGGFTRKYHPITDRNAFLMTILSRSQVESKSGV